MSDQEVVTSDLVKPKKPRTQAQVDAFAKAREKRHERLRSLNKPTEPIAAPIAPPKAKPRAQIISEESSSSSEDEEPHQIIIRRKHKSKPKPKAKPQIVYEESEASSEEENVPQRRSQSARKSSKSAVPVQAPHAPQVQSCGLLFI